MIRGQYSNTYLQWPEGGNIAWNTNYKKQTTESGKGAMLTVIDMNKKCVTIVRLGEIV